MDVLFPNIIMENEIAQSWMTLKFDPKQVFNLPFVPVGGMNRHRDAGNRVLFQGLPDNQMNLACVPVAIKRIAQFPLGGLFFHKKSRPKISPLIVKPVAHRREMGWAALHFCP